MTHVQPILLLLASVLAVDAAPVSRPFIRDVVAPALLGNCTQDNQCVGVSTSTCCSQKSHKTKKCGQDLQCSFCKKVIGALVTALQAVPDCSKLNFHGICQDIVIGPVTILCEPLLYAACDLVLKDIKKGISDPAEMCMQLGNCGSLGSRCGCLADGVCNEKGDVEGCCNGTVHKVIQATCMSGSRCGCHSDGECMALGGPATDCCSGKAHHTAKCAGGKRCGCLPDGACLALDGGAVSECCSGVGHFSAKCAGSLGRVCGPKLDDSTPGQPNPAPPPVFDCKSVKDETACESHNTPPYDGCGWCTATGSNGTWSGCLPDYEIKTLPPATFKCSSAPPSPGPHCTDDEPPGTAHSCAQQKAWGKCGASWMKGYCCQTCHECQGGCAMSAHA